MRTNILVIAALAGCAAPATLQQPRPSVAAGMTAGETRSCISTSASESLTIIDDGVVGYRSGRITWLNRLPARCAGLHPLNTLVVEAQGSQICRGDRIRVIQHPLTIPGPTCILGNFQAYRSDPLIL